MASLISIIIPIYNSASYLGKCLDSILSQTYADFEAICIDDNSTDNSLEILQKYSEKDARIKVIHKKNEGVSLARNVGLDVAQGEFLLFVDSDDWIEKCTCEIAIQKILQEEADVIIWPYVRERGNESKKKVIFNHDTIFDQTSIQEKLHRRMIGIIDQELEQPENADALCTVWGKLYRRSIVEENHLRFYDIRKIGSYEDGLFNLQYFQYANKAIYVNQYFYHYRRTNAFSITEVYNSDLNRQWESLFKIMADYIADYNLNEKYVQALKNRISLSLIPLGINEISQKGLVKNKIVGIKRIICSKGYKSAIKTLDIKFMPFHWKIFFMAAKAKNAFAVFVLLSIVQRIRGK
ncbi:glycosyltransferase family 2 protein [Sellimonas caecigallum]|uniref:Glycosyltransferase family 2 protein n=1 Tax=Sellimonas caecigallum TaxID=2592333 RepID=A0ABS7L8C7_9FIRM|nr:glycosyltransferase [Sellimonas caecigallum]MBY0759325.1 glycosyltransferase family 2 protein [Sellimonas caecigallum]